MQEEEENRILQEEAKNTIDQNDPESENLSLCREWLGQKYDEMIELYEEEVFIQQYIDEKDFNLESTPFTEKDNILVETVHNVPENMVSEYKPKERRRRRNRKDKNSPQETNKDKESTPGGVSNHQECGKQT